MFKATSLFVFLTISLYSQAQQCSGKLSGHVHNSASHENLERATIFLQQLNKTLVTDDKGDFIFDSLCNGTYTLTVSHINHQTLVKQVTVSGHVHLDVDLIQSKNTLKEITVTAQRSMQNTGMKRELSGKELENTRGQSLAEALNRVPGVTLLQTGSTVSKPVIHGLHSSRILTINNGVRQEGQQWGNEHAPEIDPYVANRLTVVKGVDELRYGSDAIGGVILVEPKALRSSPGYNAEFNTAYFTNNRQYTASAQFEQQLEKFPNFAYRIQATYKKGANATTPHYRLNNTGLEERNFSLTAGWHNNHFSTEVYYSFFDALLAIFRGSHIGNLTDLQTAIDAPRPASNYIGQNSYQINRPYQAVNHQLLKWKSTYQHNDHKYSLVVAGQFNDRDEYDIVRSSTNTKPQLDLTIYTLSEDFLWEQPRKNNLQGILGIAAMQQDNTYSGRYLIPNYKAYTNGGYYIEKWSKSKWEAQGGLRYDNKIINTNRLRSGGILFDQYSFNFSTLASSFNLGFRPNEHWKINSNLALSSRAPQVNELLSNGIHHGTATFEEGNIFLRPEKALNLSLNNSFSTTKGGVAMELSMYRNSIRNYIYQQPKPDEPVLTISGAFPKLVYQQTDAVLTGADFSSSIQISKQVEWVSKISILRAKNKVTDDWLILMPADRFENGISFSLPDNKRFQKSYFSAEWVQVMKQTRVPDEKNGKVDYKPAPSAYSLINADVSTTVHLMDYPLTISLGVRNLMNTAYRDYLNSLRYYTDELGRNFQLRLKLPIYHNGDR